MTARLTFAANNGGMGGGEVMLLAMVRAAMDAGHLTHVVGPSEHRGVLEKAAQLGAETTALPSDRPHYMRELRQWDRSRHGLLWCNGLVPALATSGHPARVVHLHRQPRGLHRAAARVARRGCRATVVPSHYLRGELRADHALWNWNPELSTGGPVPSDVVRIGYLGRWAHEKGIDVLTKAVGLLDQDRAVELIVAGEARFASRSTARDVEDALNGLRVPVERLGWVSSADFFRQVDVVVVPSREPESFGLVATEAMSARVPLIVSDIGALPEVVGPDHPWIARAADAKDLARVLGSFLETPIDARRRAVDNSFTRWQTYFSPAAGESRFLELLDELTTGGFW